MRKKIAIVALLLALVCGCLLSFVGGCSVGVKVTDPLGEEGPTVEVGVETAPRPPSPAPAPLP